MTIKSFSRRALRKKAHHLKPVIIIGSKGLTEQVHNEIDIALEAHELIKIKVNDHDKDDIKLMVPEICKTNRAEHIQTIGHIITVWRKARK